MKASHVGAQEPLVTQNAGVMHHKGAGLLREVCKAHCGCILSPGLQFCLPLLLLCIKLPATMHMLLISVFPY